MTETTNRVAQIKTAGSAWNRPPVDMTAMAAQLMGQMFISWLEAVKTCESEFKTHVYENEHLGDTELRKHRICLYSTLCDGEIFLLNVQTFRAMTQNPEAFKDEYPVVDQRVKELFSELIAWHGSIDAQSDIPESFKQAMREVEAGQIEDDDL